MSSQPHPIDLPKRTFWKTFHDLSAQTGDPWTLFSDFCETAALSIANSMRPDLARAERVEMLLGRYTATQLRDLNTLGECLQAGLNWETDFLGELFVQLGFADHYPGEPFLSMRVAQDGVDQQLVAELTNAIRRDGIARSTIHPAEAGATSIALAAGLLDAGINPRTSLVLEAIAYNRISAFMSFLQLSLLELPASVYFQNTADDSLEELITPALHRLRLQHGEAPVQQFLHCRGVRRYIRTRAKIKPRKRRPRLLFLGYLGGSPMKICGGIPPGDPSAVA